MCSGEGERETEKTQKLEEHCSPGNTVIRSLKLGADVDRGNTGGVSQPLNCQMNQGNLINYNIGD